MLCSGLFCRYNQEHQVDPNMHIHEKVKISFVMIQYLHLQPPSDLYWKLKISLYAENKCGLPVMTTFWKCYFPGYYADLLPLVIWVTDPEKRKASQGSDSKHCSSPATCDCLDFRCRISIWYIFHAFIVTEFGSPVVLTGEMANNRQDRCYSNVSPQTDGQSKG